MYQVRPLWKNFFKTASGFIFVCDSTDIVHAKEELRTFINDEWISNDAPILVLAYCENGASISGMHNG